MAVIEHSIRHRHSARRAASRALDERQTVAARRWSEICVKLKAIGENDPQLDIALAAYVSELTALMSAVREYQMTRYAVAVATEVAKEFEGMK